MNTADLLATISNDSLTCLFIIGFCAHEAAYKAARNVSFMDGPDARELAEQAVDQARWACQDINDEVCRRAFIASHPTFG